MAQIWFRPDRYRLAASVNPALEEEDYSHQQYNPICCSQRRFPVVQAILVGAKVQFPLCSLTLRHSRLVVCSSISLPRNKNAYSVRYLQYTLLCSPSPIWRGDPQNNHIWTESYLFPFFVFLVFAFLLINFDAVLKRPLIVHNLSHCHLGFMWALHHHKRRGVRNATVISTSGHGGF